MYFTGNPKRIRKLFYHDLIKLKTCDEIIYRQALYGVYEFSGVLKVKKVIAALLLVFFIAGITTACGSSDIDMNKFIDKMKKENQVSPEKKQEIRKSIFPNLKDN